MDKESWRRGGDSRPDPRGETSFDELAKGLANGTISRRQALRWMGGAVVGGVLASIPGVALAQEGGNSACDEFCHQNFSGRAAGKCTSAGAHGTGPCYECTPGIGPGPNFVTPECPGGEFNLETCECEQISACSGSQEPCDVAFPCGSSEFGECVCFITAAGPHRCFQFSPCGGPCVTDSDCPSGFACAVNCCGSVCYPLCGTPPTTSVSQDLQGTGVRSG